MTPKNPEISRPLTERLTELTSDLRRTQELAKGGLLPLERRSLAMLEELGLLHCRKEEAAVLPQEQAAFEAFGAAWERLRSVEEAVRAGDGPSSTHASAIQEMQVQARELKVVLNAPALARVEAAEAEVKRLREALTPTVHTKAAFMGEFFFGIELPGEDGEGEVRRVMVPWTTVKEIMAAISARAALATREARA